MASITVPSEFFAGELRVYGDWRSAFARELLQNAVDAAPSFIDITTTTVDGRGRVVFTDNGAGMSRRVLEEVFFALGRTTKSGEGSVGGFGRARMIICFAQHTYEIRTGNLWVTGCGGEYTITEVDEFVRGCRFTVNLIDDDDELIEEAFARVLRACSLQVPVTLNGTQVRMPPLPSRAARVLRDTEDRAWGRVYVTGAGIGQMQVRVRGLTMFSRYITGSENIVLELSAARSREVLSASRDTLHTQFGDQLDEFVNALATNRRQALRPPAEPLSVHVGGGGFLISDPADATVEDSSAGTGAATAGRDLGDGVGIRVPVTPANEAAYVNLLSGVADRVVDGSMFEVPRPRQGLGFDMFLLADTTDTRVRKLARAWNPASWDAAYGVGARRRNLLMAWKAACQVAVDALVASQPSVGRVMWTVGWTFDTDVEAMHTTRNGGHVLALNPVDSSSRTRYRVSSKADRRKLLAVAAHEVAHIVWGDHNEAYASLLTDLFAAIDPVEADRAIREALKA